MRLRMYGYCMDWNRDMWWSTARILHGVSGLLDRGGLKGRKSGCRFAQEPVRAIDVQVAGERDRLYSTDMLSSVVRTRGWVYTTTAVRARLRVRGSSRRGSCVMHGVTWRGPWLVSYCYNRIYIHTCAERSRSITSHTKHVVHSGPVREITSPTHTVITDVHS